MVELGCPSSEVRLAFVVSREVLHVSVEECQSTPAPLPLLIRPLDEVAVELAGRQQFRQLRSLFVSFLELVGVDVCVFAYSSERTAVEVC